MIHLSRHLLYIRKCYESMTVFKKSQKNLTLMFLVSPMASDGYDLAKPIGLTLKLLCVIYRDIYKANFKSFMSKFDRGGGFNRASPSE
jgi:hypothetical protein